VDLEDFLLRPR